MASQKPQDPLDVLQLMVNDVLVHTGKALRASRKDSQGNIAQAHASIQPKISESIYTFHCALDTLDREIIRAKSIILRDQNQLREQKQQQLQQLQQKQEAQQQQQQQVQHKQKQKQPTPVPLPVPISVPISVPVSTSVLQPPQPIEPQSKEQLIIDLDSSPPPTDHPMPEPKATKPVAPFPDMGMGMGMPDLGHGDVIVKGGSPTMTRTPAPASNNQFKSGPPAATAPMAPMPDMDEKPMDINMDMPSGDMSNQELNFTNMEFTLAPTNPEGQNPPTTQDPSFDLTTFAPAEGGDDLMAFVNPLPADSDEQPQPASVAQAPVPGMAIQAAIPVSDNLNNAPNADNGMSQYYGALRKEETNDSTFNDIMMDDGVDDFGDVGGMGEETFDDLIAVRDEPFDLMEHGDFDATYFGLNADGS
ncbi:hypothetical protein B0T10DRAFT_485608 [Thelonectria olida]|uniref:Uncharacterized protein n=1 Tax=Thelonectria olida TaxID=1576542 RepID=A0A9P8W5Q7_9HYPO|nr:hypothetical protein B0T10DRAFT_485608 [Thelonectria olida]